MFTIFYKFIAKLKLSLFIIKNKCQHHKGNKHKNLITRINWSKICSKLSKITETIISQLGLLGLLSCLSFLIISATVLDIFKETNNGTNIINITIGSIIISLVILSWMDCFYLYPNNFINHNLHSIFINTKQQINKYYDKNKAQYLRNHAK